MKLKVAPAKMISKNDVKISRATTTEITKRILCMFTCLAILIASVITLLTINQVENSVSEHHVDYEDASSYREAAIWSVCASSSGMVYSILMAFIRYHCLNPRSVSKKYLKFYVIMNAVLCVLFALCLFSGGVVNALYSADDHQLSPDMCATTAGKLNHDDKEICTNILKVKISEGVSAGFSFLSMLVFGSLFIYTLGSYPRKVKVGISQDQSMPSPPPPAAQDTSSHPSNPPHASYYQHESAIALL